MKRYIYLISPQRIKGVKFYKELHLILKTNKIEYFQLRLKKISNSNFLKISKKIKKGNALLVYKLISIISMKLNSYCYNHPSYDNKLEYEISRDSYLYVVNGLDVEEGFNGKIKFSETLIHHKIETDYLDNEIQNMIDTINSTKIPDPNERCKNCAYARQRSKTDRIG